ncbi:MAG: acylneuraminate cytidylyltransferase [Microbacterium pygmaeum]
MSEAIAIIPARGGSKGIPRKNLQRVGGVPLIGRAILSARAVPGIDRVLVSTDDEEIAAVAREWGAGIVARPAEIAGDTASSESALLHALETLDGDGIDVGVLAFLQATSPFIDSAALGRAIDSVRRGEADSVFAAIETYGFLWRAHDGSATGINHDAAFRPRRQDREPHFLETGAFYVMDAAGFRSAGHRFFGRIGIAEVPERTAIEIDSPEQLEMARSQAHRLDASDRALDVDAVVTDFDGVHTNDTALVDADGNEQVPVSRSDGMGIAMLRREGIPVLILSTEQNPVVTARARKLRVDVRQGVDEKAAALRAWADQAGVTLERIAYLGNDVNDLPCLEIVGWPVATADAHPLVIAAARVVLRRTGGDGVVRELADAVLRGRRSPAGEASSPSPTARSLQ